MRDWEDDLHEEFAEYLEESCKCDVDEDCDCMSFSQFCDFQLKKIADHFEGMDEQDYEEMYG